MKIETDRLSDWELRVYPRDDGDFLRDAHAAIASSWEKIRNGEHVLDEARLRLRGRYPACELSYQDDLAQLGGYPTVIYAFRDGHAA